jgi:RimJ/RimL family protein N-acetyltransferase
MAVVVIRDALPQDAAASIALRKAIFAETDFLLYAPAEYLTTPDELSAQTERTAASGHSRSMLAELDGTLVGLLGVIGSPIPRVRHSAQLYIGVLRNYWGRGIGSALLAEVQVWAPRAGISRLELFVMKDNARAIALYERLGFRVEGARRRAYIINGRPVDDLLMAYVSEA